MRHSSPISPANILSPRSNLLAATTRGAFRDSHRPCLRGERRQPATLISFPLRGKTHSRFFLSFFLSLRFALASPLKAAPVSVHQTDQIDVLSRFSLRFPMLSRGSSAAKTSGRAATGVNTEDGLQRNTPGKTRSKIFRSAKQLIGGGKPRVVPVVEEPRSKAVWSP